MPSMSSPSVCHQSRLEHQQANPELIMLRIHKWVRPTFVSHDPCSVVKGNRGNDDGWNSTSFLYSPAQDSAPPPPTTYLKHALRRSSNLDMCTETLGCETGAMCSAFELEAAQERKKLPPPTLTMQRSRQRSSAPLEFPPPLTTLCGEGRLRLGRKREEGRLLLFPFKPFLLEAERSGGRLLLRVLPSGTAAKETEEEREAEKEEKEEEGGAEETGGFLYGGGSGKNRRRTGRCKEEEGGGGPGKMKMSVAAIFNCETYCVASS